ncbi:uncharacterized protein LOC115439906 [Manduca sexta]|uniref:uncharacterized protein LOC115439906 n=2 Tax=Manduca sexta TaxID=7130 RepID=UPI00188F2361|nr:uncharacterized protein LOC115439906 [Manduca sexta]
MRCSLLRRARQANSSNSEEDNKNYRILQDLNKHHWLLKKLKWEIKTTKRNHKDFMEPRPRTIAGLMRINEVDVAIINEETSNAEAAAPPQSLPVSLPVNLYNRVNGTGLRVRPISSLASVRNVSDNMAPDPKDVEVAYNEITKEFNRSLRVSEPIVQSGPYDIMEIPVGEDPNNNSEQSRMDDTNAERATCIKHRLPLAAPPERTKYAYSCHNSASTSDTAIDFHNKRNGTNMEVQTDDVIIINESYKKLIDYITSKNITLEQLQTAFAEMERNNEATNAEATPNIDMKGMMREQFMQVVEACSLYNKEIIAYNTKVVLNVSQSALKAERSKIAYLRCMFEKIFGSVFQDLSRSLKLDENSLTPEVSETSPRNVNVRKRRSSVPAVPLHDDTDSGDMANATDSQSGPVVKKPTLRAQRISPRASSATLVTYNNEPHYTQTTKVVQLETSYSNSHPSQHMEYINHQNPCPQPYHVQGEIPVETPMPYYNAGARMMMQPYPQVQFMREPPLHCQYHDNVGNSWNYPRNGPEVRQNVQVPYVNGVPLSVQVMPPADQQRYLRMQVQRNNMRMPNYTGPRNQNVGPNSHNIM